METGTLKELNLKPGDVVEWVDFEPIGHHTLDFIDGEFFEFATSRGPYTHHLKCTDRFRIISRASDTPKTWGEMTDAEKGALLLAAHEGKVIEHKSSHKWREKKVTFRFNDNGIYRVRPEPVRETVTLTGYPARGYFHHDLGSQDTHRITFTLTDGTPDCTKCPTCGTAKHVDMEEL